MPTTQEVAIARKAKKRRENREFAAAIAGVISLLLALNVAAYCFLFDDNWAPSARSVLLISGLLVTTLLFWSIFKRIGNHKC